MSKPKHTPGPWRVTLPDECIVTNDDGHEVADCSAWYEGFPETCAANARLIAAAPDMLAALKKIIATGNTPPLPGESAEDMLKEFNAFCEIIDDAELLIRKVESV